MDYIIYILLSFWKESQALVHYLLTDSTFIMASSN